jgi:thiamine-monophosphate kinase
VAAADSRVVISTDLLAEGHHFRFDWSSPRQVGQRAAVQALSDIAAMGARPTALLTALTLPLNWQVEWVEDLAAGLADVCAPRGIGMVGGDLSAGDSLIIAVTVLGDLAGRPAVTRAGAHPGGIVALAGRLGDSAAGLAVLQHGDTDQLAKHLGASAHLIAEVVAAFQTPAGCLEAGVAASQQGALAMIDISDGLLIDAQRVAEASRVMIDIDPRAATLADQARRLRPLAVQLGCPVRDWLLAGGEDHALLAVFPLGALLPEEFTAVGWVRAADVVKPGVLIDGQVPPPGLGGWDHFSRGAPAC